jgi:leucyl-tRNA synthetase
MSDSATPSTPAATNFPTFRYSARLAAEIESRWQDTWEREGTYNAPNPAGPMAEPDRVAGREKLFVLDMFPYPSGAGLHVGLQRSSRTRI